MLILCGMYSFVKAVHMQDIGLITTHMGVSCTTYSCGTGYPQILFAVLFYPSDHSPTSVLLYKHGNVSLLIFTERRITEIGYIPRLVTTVIVKPVSFLKVVFTHEGIRRGLCCKRQMKGTLWGSFPFLEFPANMWPVCSQMVSSMHYSVWNMLVPAQRKSSWYTLMHFRLI